MSPQIGNLKMQYLDLFPSQDFLNKIRKELYHSEKPGYYVVKGFLNETFVNHIKHFWCVELIPERTHTMIDQLDKPNLFFKGCDNYYYPNPYGKTYFNYFWNAPFDEVTYAVAWKIVEFRNLVQSKNFFKFMFPYEGRSVGFRVVQTMGGETIVPYHRDWLERNFDPSMLQATLILSEEGKDYKGKGMVMKDNQGKEEISFCQDLGLEAGDLVLWRYNNEHAVIDVSSNSDQIGFLRMIFPPEKLHPVPDKVKFEGHSAKALASEFAVRVKRKFTK